MTGDVRDTVAVAGGVMLGTTIALSVAWSTTF